MGRKYPFTELRSLNVGELFVLPSAVDADTGLAALPSACAPRVLVGYDQGNTTGQVLVLRRTGASIVSLHLGTTVVPIKYAGMEYIPGQR